MSTAMILVGIVGGVLTLYGVVMGFLSENPNKPLPPEIADLPIYDPLRAREMDKRDNRGCYWFFAGVVLTIMAVIECVLLLI
jgi:hypothetical protein